MNKKISTQQLFIIILISTSFLLSSCQQGFRYEEVDIYKGSEGIDFEVLPNNPPNKVYSTEVFPVAVNIHNKGAFTLTEPFKASLSIIYDEFYFQELDQSKASLIQARSTISLQGKTSYWPAGEQRFLTLALLQAQSLRERTGAKNPILLSICYPYQTTLATQVCVDANPSGIDQRDQICKAQSQSFNDQGAPVAIKNLEFASVPVGTDWETVISNEPVRDDQGYIVGTQLRESRELITTVRPLFKFTIQNVGKGQIVRARDFDQQKLCEPAQTGDYPSNTALVRANLGGIELDCTPNPVRFINDRAEVSCTLPAEELLAVYTNYYSTLQVQLAYVYQERQTHNIEILDTIKEYTPPQLLVARCSDFHNKPEECRTYGQQGEAISNSLDCYYCQENGQCTAGKSSCEECQGFTVADELTRRCAASCSNQAPTVLPNHEQQSAHSVTVACNDPQGVNTQDHHLCGCSHIHYGFINADEECPQSISPDIYTQRQEAVWVSQRQWSQATIVIPANRQQTTSKLCVSASTPAGVYSQTRTFMINQ